MTERMVRTDQDFAEIRAMGWSGCFHDSDCACTDAMQMRDIEILGNWSRGGKPGPHSDGMNEHDQLREVVMENNRLRADNERLRAKIAAQQRGIDRMNRKLDQCAATAFPGHPDPVPNRILWNKRGGDIDEIVISNCVVHVEQMDDRVWWIGITRADGGYWAGNFRCDSRGRMTFTEQEHRDFTWDRDDTHELARLPRR